MREIKICNLLIFFLIKKAIYFIIFNKVNADHNLRYNASLTSKADLGFKTKSGKPIIFMRNVLANCDINKYE